MPKNLEEWGKTLAFLSTLSVIWSAIYSLGFFYEVGSAFSGVFGLPSFTSIVGAFFGGLVSILLVAWGVVDIAADFKKLRPLWIATHLVLGVLIFLLPILAFTIPYEKWWVSGSIGLTIWMGIGVLSQCFSILQFYGQKGEWPVRQIAGMLVLATVATFVLSRASAHWLAFSSPFYDVHMKKGNPRIIRILWATSDGLLISEEGKISYLPKDTYEEIILLGEISRQ